MFGVGREEHETGQRDSSCLEISLTGPPGNCHGRKKMPTITTHEQSTISGQKKSIKIKITMGSDKTKAFTGGTGDEKHLNSSMSGPRKQCLEHLPMSKKSKTQLELK